MRSPHNKRKSFLFHFLTLAVSVLCEVVEVEGEGLRVVQSGGLDPCAVKNFERLPLALGVRFVTATKLFVCLFVC